MGRGRRTRPRQRPLCGRRRSAAPCKRIPRTPGLRPANGWFGRPRGLLCYGRTRALVAEFAPGAARAVRAGLRGLVVGEVDAPPFRRVVPAAAALLTAQRQDEDMVVVLRLFHCRRDYDIGGGSSTAPMS